MNPLQFQLKQLVKLFETAKIDYAILGGVAVSVYGEPRLTFDIDINIMLDNSRIGDFLKRAREFGFTPLPSNIKKFVKTTGVIPVKFSKNKITGRCDFIIAQNILEHLCIKRARFKKIYSVRAKIVTAEDLIIHKITSQRPKDLEDARGILIRQRGKLDKRYIGNWLKKIGEISRQPELFELFRSLKPKEASKMRKKFLILSCSFAFCVLNFAFSSYAQESITITTYYPSPYGSYDELATNKLAVDINGVAVAPEFAAMQNGDAHIGRSLIIGAGGGSGFAYDEGATTADGTLLVKGNAGIGTTTPGAKLEVYQDASSSWRLGEHPSYVNYSALWNSGRGNAAGSYVLLADNANTFLNAFGAGNLYFREDNNNLMTILNGGNVGIGMTPVNRLHVSGAIGATSWIGAGCEVGCETSGGYSLLYPEGYGVLTSGLKIGSWEQMTSNSLKTDGNAYFMGDVGIGKTNPTFKLDVDAGTNTGILRLQSRNPGNIIRGMRIERTNAVGEPWRFNSGDGFAFQEDGTTRITFLESGRVGILRTPSGTAALAVGGIIEVDNLAPLAGTTLCRNANNRLSVCSSSRKGKDNISYLKSSDEEKILKDITDTKIARFRMKEDKYSNLLRVGIIAEESPQDLQFVDENGNPNIDFLSAQLGYTWAAIKVLDKRIEELQKENQELKVKLSSFR